MRTHEYGELTPYGYRGQRAAGRERYAADRKRRLASRRREATSRMDGGRSANGHVGLLVLVMSAVMMLLLAISVARCSSLEGDALAEGQQVAASAGTQTAPTEGGDTNEAASSQVAEADSDWNLVLVNKDHSFQGQTPELVEVEGAKVDKRCAESLEQMFAAARAAGVSPAINSAYRSREEQQAILDSAIEEQIGEGMTQQEARAHALGFVAIPGTSEHETGLAVDMTSEYRDGDAEDVAVHDWLAEHSWEYGWILRYPLDKVSITGINNEPWHYRYVGTTAAKEMHDRGLCLEEYLG